MPSSDRISPSRSWARAMPAPPDASVKITTEYAAHVARDGLFLGVAARKRLPQAPDLQRRARLHEDGARPHRAFKSTRDAHGLYRA